MSNGNEQISVRSWETRSNPNSVTILNSLAPDGFSNWTNTSNIVTTDPMFTDTNETTIDVSKLQSGMYILEVISNQKNSTKRFIKQ